MKVKALIELIEQGKKPMVRLTGVLWDDSFGQKGMLARVTDFVEATDTVKFAFDFNENREHNLNLDQPNWYLAGGGTGTAIESGMFKDGNIHEEIHFDENDEVPVELAEDDTPLAEYLASGSEVPYVQWLEAKLEELVPDAMKTWKKEL